MTDKITQAELKEWFGGTEMPIDAAAVLFEEPPTRSIDEMRAKLREMGSAHKKSRGSMYRRLTDAVKANLKGDYCYEYAIDVLDDVLDIVLDAMHNPDHDITGAVVKPGDDRWETVRTWNAMLDAISEGK